MKLAIDLNYGLAEELKSVSDRLGVSLEELPRAAVNDLVAADSEEFQAAAERVQEKNRELYKRLS
jgi:DNA-directed RNA polymerase subunit H (RpoH/RPB5)